MTDDTRPTSTDTDAGTFQEARFRADYLHSQACYPEDPADYDPADSEAAAEYAAPWMSSARWYERDWTAEWVYLDQARDRWNRDPAAAAAHVADHTDELTPVQRRSEDQARHLTENGITRDSYGQVSGPYIEAVEQRGAIAHAPHDVYLYRYADRVARDEEVLMRADYDRAQDMRERAENPVIPEAADGMRRRSEQIQKSWADREDELGRAWRELDTAQTQWQTYPAMSQLALTEHETAHARGEAGRFTGMQWRNHLHARALTGHGEWSVDEPGPEPGRTSKSALAKHRGRNALATDRANERDGAER